MNLASTALLALAMSTDAFAAAVGKGTALERPHWPEALRTGVIFGSIEATTPVIGWLIGAAAARYVTAWDHWIAFVLLGILGVPLLWQQMEKLQYVILRMTSFFDPGGGTREVSYQLRQSLIAVGSGRLFGRGFGEGHQQYGFLPFPFSDFIGSNVGEEWGFIGIAALVVAYAVYGGLGMRIARAARTPFLSLVAVGLTFTVVSTAFIHLGVVIGLLPTTGLTLPFVSYGRSNLLLSLLSTGILVNIGSVRERVGAPRADDPLGAV